MEGRHIVGGLGVSEKEEKASKLRPVYSTYALAANVLHFSSFLVGVQLSVGTQFTT